MSSMTYRTGTYAYNQARRREVNASANSAYGQRNAEITEARLRQDPYGAIVANIVKSPMKLSFIGSMAFMAWGIVQAVVPLLVGVAVLGGCIMCAVSIIKEIGKTLSGYIYPERNENPQE